MRRHAIIIAHGQPSQPAPLQAATEALAAKVAPLCDGWHVAGATLADREGLARAVRAAGDGAVIYPMFMAEGWFTKRELPRRLSEAGAARPVILPPFGSDAALPALCRDLATSAAGQDAARSTVLLLAHGSQRARASAEFAAAMAATLAPDFGRVLTGFIEEAPFARDAARGLGSDAICLPLFATRAEHVTKDIPEALDAAGFTGRLLDPVGCAPLVPSLIARAITAAAPRA